MSDFLHSTELTHILISLIIVILAFSLWQAVRQVYRMTAQTAGVKGERATLIRVCVDCVRFFLLAGTILLILTMKKKLG